MSSSMKKRILLPIAVLLIGGLTAFALMKAKAPASSEIPPSEMAVNSESDFIYELGPRYAASISKTDLLAARSAQDIIPEEADWTGYPVEGLHLSLLETGKPSTISGPSLELTEEQLGMIASMAYEDNFRLIANCKGPHPGTGLAEEYNLTYYISVVPEQQATYSAGNEAFISYMKNGSRDATNLIDDSLMRPGQINFTVAADGSISNLEVINSCGYRHIDEVFSGLIENAPAEWTTAFDAAGNPIEQTLTFWYGRGAC